MPTISIIVPVYKVEPYLHRCVDSILAQTFTDFELILVDDGSPDNCPAICDEYAKKDKRIKVIHKKNGGLASARNAGLLIASGEFVMFVDSDDFILFDTCEIMYSKIFQNPRAWVICNMSRVNEKDEFVSGMNTEEALTQFNNRPTYFNTFLMSLSGSCCNKIYNMQIIKNNNISFDDNIRFGEDVPFDTPYCKLCDKIIFVPEPLYNYRVVEGSLTKTYHPNHLEVYIKLFAIRLPLINESELTQFCDIYFHYFVSLLDNTMDPRNPMSFIQKMKYNNKMMNTPEFKYCVSNSSGKKDSKLFMRIIKLHNYYIYWLFQKACVIKGKLFNRNTGEKQ